MHHEPTPSWNRLETELRQAVGEFTYDAWFSSVEVKAWDGSVLTLQGKPGTERFLAERFGRVVNRCARDVLGPGATVAFAGDPAAAAHDALSAPGRAHADPHLPEQAFVPRFTFEQFVIGNGNRLAHAAALAVAEVPGQAYSPLFLHAPPGLGKTHLLHAIGNYVRAFEPATTVRYTTVEAFTNGFLAALNGHALERFKQLYRSVDVLLIDDVQFLASKARTEEEFFHTFNALYDSGRQLVLTCDRLPEQLVGIEQRLRERFESGLIAHLKSPDRATRVAILRKRAALDNVVLPDVEILDLIADRITDNIRSLEGALIRVVATHSLTGQPLDQSLTETVLDQIHPAPAGKDRAGDTPVGEIQRVVASHFGLSAAELVSPSRAAPVAWARQLAIYIARELTNMPVEELGRVFGGRNHTTVLHACKRVSERAATSQDDNADLQQLLASVGNTN